MGQELEKIMDKLTIITEDDYLDMAGDWGMEDATEGIPRRPTDYFASGSLAEKSYLVGYVDGLAQLQKLTGQRTIAYFCDADARTVNEGRGIEPVVSLMALLKLFY